MARNVTLSQLRTDVAAQADVVTSASGRYTPTLLTRRINQSVQRFRERICAEGIAHYLVSTSGTLSAGATSPYSFQELDLSNVSPSIVRVFGVDITYSNVVSTLAHRPFQERNDFGGPSTTGIPRAWAAYNTRKVAVMPAPDQNYAYTVWYLPVVADLSADGDTFDGVAGWEDWIVWDVVCQIIARDTYPTAYQQATQQRLEVWEDIKRSATKVTAAGGAIVGRDTLRSTFLRGRSFDGAIGGPAALPPNGSITNAILADMREGTTKGRMLGAGAGSPTDLTPIEMARNVSVYSGLAAGLVPTGTNGTTNFLREDGTWQAPAGGSGTGIGFGALQQMPPDHLLGRTAASGTPTSLSVATVATLIPPFNALEKGTVPAAGLLSGGLFLRSDATWAGVPSSIPTGINYNQLAAMPEAVLGRFAPSGVPTFLSGSAVGTMLPLFNTVDKGVVPPPGVVSNNFLRDDGTWQTVAGGAATGVANSMLLAMPPFSIKGRNDILSGIPQDLLMPAVASMLPNHFGGSGTTRGLVYSPTAGTLNRFLRDDGSWQGVPSIAATGLLLSQLELANPFNVLGRFTLGTGAIEQLPPGRVASLLPDFFVASGGTRGLVWAPTGGAAGNFLRDDGSWQAAGGGSGAAVGPGMPTGSFQYAGSGFHGASGFRFTASGISNEYGFLMPTGSIQMGATGGVPEVEIGNVGGRLSVGFGLTPSGGDLLFGRSASSNNLQILARDSDGYGALREVVAIDRRNAPSGALDAYFGNPSNTRSANLRGFFANIVAAHATGTIQGQLGANNAEAFAARPGHHSWGVSGSQRLGLDQRGLHSWGQVGIQPLAHGETLDKLTTVTPSGFVNIATGITIGASGYRLSVGSGGPQLHGSGIDLRSADIGNVRRINGLDGIKLYGLVPGGGAASGGQDIVAASGSAFVVPETTTAGQIFALVPTLAIQGDTILLENRTALSHMVNNTGTGMGAPSGFVATLAPSGGYSFRFASGAWEPGSQYKLGGF